MTKPMVVSSDALRWVVRRKAEVVEAVRKGELSFAEACQRYHLSSDELISWQDAYKHHGLEGLRAMRLQTYRPSA